MKPNRFNNWFDRWIANNPLSNRKLGALLGLSGARISHYRKGQGVPPRRVIHRMGAVIPFGFDVEQAEWMAGLIPQEWADKLSPEDYEELFMLCRLMLLAKESGKLQDTAIRYMRAFVERTEGETNAD